MKEVKKKYGRNYKKVICSWSRPIFRLVKRGTQNEPDFLPKINIFKRKYFVNKYHAESSKIGQHFHKILKFAKNVSDKKCIPQLMFLNEKKIVWFENSLWKLEFGTFYCLANMPINKINRIKPSPSSH